MSWASDKEQEIWDGPNYGPREAVRRAIRETLAAAIQAVYDAGGDNEDYHAAAIRQLGEP